MKRTLSILLALIMMLMLLPLAAFADTGDIASGVFSKNEAISWKIGSDYTLTISGKGEMPYECPWSDYMGKIKAINVKSGISFVMGFEGMTAVKSVSLPKGLSAIGNRAFANCTGITSIEIPETVTSIASGAFSGCTSLEKISIPSGVTKINLSVFENCGKLKTVYYAGSEAQWKAMPVAQGNDALAKADVKYNSTAPSAPEIKVSTANVSSSGKIKLSWNTVSGAAKYEIYRASSKTGSFTKLYTTTKTSYTNTSAKVGYTYYYKVKALDSSGKAIITSSVVSRTCDCAAPSVKAANVSSSGKIKLSWSAIDGASKYEIYRATSKTGSFTKLYTTTKTSFTNTSAKAGNTYYYKVKAIAEKTTAANSAFSTVVSKVCDCAAPVVKTSNVQSSGKIKLSWSAIDGAAKYEVYRASSKTGSFTKLYTTTKTSYTNTSAKVGYTYYYKVKAISEKTKNANSAYSSLVSRTCDCAMMNVTLDYSTSGKPVFTWDGVSGAASYKIYRASSSKGTYKLIADTSSLKFTDTDASAGYYYFYKFVAVSSRSSAANSAELKAKIAAVPSQPKNVSQTKSDIDTYRVSWSPVKGADGYLVLISESKNSDEMVIWSETSSTSEKIPMFIDPTAALKNYYVRIASYCVMSDGSYAVSQPSGSVKLQIAG